jgi:glycogen operon protein
MLNAYWDALTFELPKTAAKGRSWRRMVDTFLPSPSDIFDGLQAPRVPDSSYTVHPHSVVILVIGGSD